MVLRPVAGGGICSQPFGRRVGDKPARQAPTNGKGPSLRIGDRPATVGKMSGAGSGTHIVCTTPGPSLILQVAS